MSILDGLKLQSLLLQLLLLLLVLSLLGELFEPLVLLFKADPLVIALRELQVNSEHLFIEVIQVLTELCEGFLHLCDVVSYLFFLLVLGLYLFCHGEELVRQGLFYLFSF